MSVGQARQHDHVGRVDGASGGRVYLRRDRGNAVALDEDIAARQVAKVAIHRDDGGAFHQNAIHIRNASSVRRTMGSASAVPQRAPDLQPNVTYLTSASPLNEIGRASCR